MDLNHRPVWRNIYLDRVVHNVQEVRRRIGNGPEIMAVVKADAYGHGAIPIARAALSGGASRLAVALVEEGIALRKAGIGVPIQAMAGFTGEQIEGALEHNIILTLGTLAQAQEVSRRARSRKQEVRVHVKVDTGMGRYGLLEEEAVDLAVKVHSLPGLILEGLMSHMASADERDKGPTRKQCNRFREVAKALTGRGVHVPYNHIANSATIIDMPEMAMDMVRPGLMLYGLWPGEVGRKVDLEPVMEWKARIIQVKSLPQGHGVSYGSTYRVAEENKIALLPLGYADGFDRGLSNKGVVLCRGKRAPVRGRVCMDQLVIDVTHIDDVQAGDEVVLLGRQGEEFLSAEGMATLVETINYEVVTRIGLRVPRMYKNE